MTTYLDDFIKLDDDDTETKNPFLTEKDTYEVEKLMHEMNPVVNIIVKAALALNPNETRPLQEDDQARSLIDEDDWTEIVQVANSSWWARCLIEGALTTLYKNMYNNVIAVSLSLYHGDLVLMLPDNTARFFERPIQNPL